MKMNIKTVFLIIILLIVNFNIKAEPIFVMINPAGHAKDVGRKLVEDYERSTAFKMAEVLKEKLQDEYGLRCVLTRYPGEEIVDLQNASFANRLGVDFYLDLRLFRQDIVKPKIFIYHLVYNPMVDLASRVFDPYKFISVGQSHFLNISNTQSYGRKIKDILTQEYYKKSFDCLGLFGIPIKPLVGLIAPAICIEIGICEQDQWQSLIDPIVKSLNFLSRDKL
ncbi:MAG: hypothetical protein ABIF12_03035 [bacterium]